ncbi:hypothetical protein FNF28_00065 [Cafeteria roenbergensis]|uniref:EGF-like domain-containing protein n=1 Tax=Cafeteria roenbergensis TaxID=33653 RepID=A0A5A8E3N6_CAFRO|nr:hypothetical protein FNF28_00065 [Cafeteria roenbergensis]
MQGFDATDLTVDAGSLTGVSVVPDTAAATEDTAWYFVLTLPDATDTDIVLTLALTGSTVTFTAAGSLNVQTVRLDMTPPSITVGAAPQYRATSLQAFSQALATGASTFQVTDTTDDAKSNTLTLSLVALSAGGLEAAAACSSFEHTGARVPTCIISGTDASDVIPSGNEADRTFTLRATDTAGNYAEDTITVRVRPQPSLAFSGTDAAAGTSTLTVTWTAAVASWADQSNLNLVGITCVALTTSDSGATYSGTCTADGSTAAPQASITTHDVAGHGGERRRGGHVHVQEKTGGGDHSTTAMVGPSSNISPKRNIEVKFTFSGNMQGFDATDLTVDAGSLTGVSVVPDTAAATEDTAWYFVLTLPDATDTDIVLTLALTGSTVTFTAAGSLNVQTVRLDMTPPSITVGAAPQYRATSLQAFSQALATGASTFQVTDTTDDAKSNTLTLSLVALSAGGLEAAAACSSFEHTGAGVPTCIISGTDASDVIPSGNEADRTFTLRATDTAGNYAEDTITVRVRPQPSLAFSGTDAAAGTSTLTVTWTAAVASWADQSNLNLVGITCVALTTSDSGATYSGTCTADGSTAAPQASITTTTSLDTGASVGAAATFTYSPELTAVALLQEKTGGGDHSTTAMVGPSSNISPKRNIEVKFTFSGNMQGFDATDLTVDAGSLTGVSVVPDTADATEDTAWYFVLTLPDATDTDIVLTLALTGSTVTFTAAGSLNVQTVRLDMTPPSITVGAAPQYRATSLQAFSQALATGASTFQVTDTTDDAKSNTLTLSLVALSAGGLEAAAACSSFEHTGAGVPTCIISGTDASDVIPSGNEADRTFTLRATDTAGNYAEDTITVRVRPQPSLAFSGTDAAAGTSTLTVTWTAAVASWADQSNLNLVGITCVALTTSDSGATYSGTCTADGSTAAPQASITTTTSLDTGASVGAAATFTYSPKLTSMTVVDTFDAPLKGPGADIIKSQAVKVIAVFAGKMQGLSTGSLAGFADAAQVASIDPSSGVGTSFTFAVTLDDADSTTITLGLSAPTLAFTNAAAVSNSLTVWYDSTDPTVTAATIAAGEFHILATDDFAFSFTFVTTAGALHADASQAFAALEDTAPFQTADLTLTITGKTVSDASGLSLAGCTGAKFSSGCSIAGSAAGSIPAGESGDRTLVMEAVDLSGRASSAEFTLQIRVRPTLTLSTVDAKAGTYSITVDWSQAVSGFLTSHLTLQGLTCGSLTSSLADKRYSGDCIATGTHATVGVSLAAALSGVSPTTELASQVTKPYTPELTAIELIDTDSPAAALRGLHENITPNLGIAIRFTFTGKMSGLTASDVNVAGDDSGVPTVAEPVASSEAKVHTFGITLDSADVATTISLPLGASDAPFSWTSASAETTVYYDVTAPTATLSASDFFLTDGSENQVLDIVTQVLASISDNISPTSRIILDASSDPDVSGVLSLSACSRSQHQVGCLIKGAAASNKIPPDNTGVSTITLLVEDEAGNSLELEFFLVRQAVIAFTADQSKLSKSGHFAPFNNPVGTRRSFSEDLSSICTSSSQPDDIVVTIALTDAAGAQSANCETVSGVTQSATPGPSISCNFDQQGTVRWSVVCSESLGDPENHADVPASTSGTWAIVEQKRPAVSASGTFYYLENAGNKLLSDEITFAISDTEDSDLRFVTVTREDCAVGKDQLGIGATPPATVTATVEADQCVITIVPAHPATEAPIGDFLQVLNAVTFTHVSDNPNRTLGVTITVNVTDDAGGEAGTPPSYALSQSSTIHFEITELNDELGLLVQSGASNESSLSLADTQLRMTEHPDDGKCLYDSNGDDVVIVIEDVDTIQDGRPGTAQLDDVGLKLLEWPGSGAMPDTELWSVVSQGDPATSPTTKTGSSLVPGSQEHFVFQQFKVCITPRGELGSAGVRRQTWQTLDFENLQPSEFSGFRPADKKYPLRFRASSPSGKNVREFTLWYQVTDVEHEKPHFFHPDAGVTNSEGIRSGFLGLQCSREFYRSSLQSPYTLQDSQLNVATGNIRADVAKVNLYREPAYTAGEAHHVVYAPIDFVHGMFNRKEIRTSTVVVDPDEIGSLVLSIRFLGEWTKAATPGNSTAMHAANETLAAGQESSLGGVFSNKTAFGFMMTHNSTHIVLTGAPQYGPEYNMSRALSEVSSPRSRRFGFSLVATHAVTGLVAERDFLVDIEVRGCMDIRGAYADGPNREFLPVDSDFVMPPKSELAKYDDLAASGWRNPSGNFNPNATIPALCTFPPRAVATTETSTFALTGARTETTAAELESALKASPTDDNIEQARGFVALEVPPGAITEPIPIEVSGVTDDVALAVAPPKEDAIVTTDLTLKLGPCGQQFERSLQVCIFVGAAQPGRYFTIYHAPAVNCELPELGYAEFQPTSETSYNPATGKACGSISSFSIVSGVSLLIPQTSQLESRFLEAGGGCPRDCSGNGECLAYSKCSCFQGWTGYDCASRTCPAADAWAINLVAPKQSAECSNKGACNRITGECECEPGFEGSACQRMGCPSDCSGHGRCRYLADLPQVSSQKQLEYAWEGDRISTCMCDPGYGGPDCSVRMCPFGDDPASHCASNGFAKFKATLAVPISEAAASGSAYPGPGVTWAVQSASLVLEVAAKHGSQFTTRPVNGLLGAAAASEADVISGVESALQALPNFHVDDAVIVTDSLSAGGEIRQVSLEMAGYQNAGDMLSVSCPAPYGCAEPGCRPRYRQPLLSAEDVVGSDIALDALGIIKPPSSANGIAVKVSVASTATYAGAAVKTFEVTICPLVATSAAITETTGDCAVSVAQRPVPSSRALDKSAAVGMGAKIKFRSAAPADGAYNFYLIPGTCAVERIRPSGADRRSTECSSRGVCDRSTGMCKCFDEFEGDSCSLVPLTV